MCTIAIQIIMEHFRYDCDQPSDSKVITTLWFSCFHFWLIFLKKKKKRFGFNLLLVIYSISNFLVCGQNGQVRGHGPGDGSEMSEATVYALDHTRDHLFLNPCAHPW